MTSKEYRITLEDEPPVGMKNRHVLFSGDGKVRAEIWVDGKELVCRFGGGEWISGKEFNLELDWIALVVGQIRGELE